MQAGAEVILDLNPRDLEYVELYLHSSRVHGTKLWDSSSFKRMKICEVFEVLMAVKEINAKFSIMCSADENK
jgi:hypothetical protein